MMSTNPQHQIETHTQGERLIRMETILEGIGRTLQDHIRQEDVDRAELNQTLKTHIENMTKQGDDLKVLKRDMSEMQTRMTSIESEVKELLKNKQFALAWAAGAGSVITLIGTLGAFILSKFAS
jgi:hypothetical protein